MMPFDSRFKQVEGITTMHRLLDGNNAPDEKQPKSEACHDGAFVGSEQRVAASFFLSVRSEHALVLQPRDKPIGPRRTR